MASKKGKKDPLTAVYIAAICVAVVIVAAIAVYNFVSTSYRGESCRLFIPKGSTAEAIGDSLARLDDFGRDVFKIWKMSGGKPTIARGSYVINPGEKALALAKRIKNGRQDPVKITFNNVRTLDQLSEKIAERMDFTPDEFKSALDSVLPPAGFKKAQYVAAFIPDTYEFYWTASPQKVISTLLDYRNRFWNDERRSRAAALGLTPVEVATVASIVEEESAKAGERPTIARLYLNRLDKKMPLQADPTVKYAVGDFGLRRITAKHLAINSPYNTYRINGLPPGPIRIADSSTLDQVLDAPKNDYLYMCAREDFSGYHNFARDLDTHNRNAARYRAELNRRGIK